MRLLSQDRQWRVTVIAVDGHGKIRVERRGNRGLTWYWHADVNDPADVAKFVPLSSLVPEEKS